MLGISSDKSGPSKAGYGLMEISTNNCLARRKGCGNSMPQSRLSEERGFVTLASPVLQDLVEPIACNMNMFSVSLFTILPTQLGYMKKHIWHEASSREPPQSPWPNR